MARIRSHTWALPQDPRTHTSEDTREASQGKTHKEVRKKNWQEGVEVEGRESYGRYATKGAGQIGGGTHGGGPCGLGRGVAAMGAFTGRHGGTGAIDGAGFKYKRNARLLSQLRCSPPPFSCKLRCKSRS